MYVYELFEIYDKNHIHSIIDNCMNDNMPNTTIICHSFVYGESELNATSNKINGFINAKIMLIIIIDTYTIYLCVRFLTIHHNVISDTIGILKTTHPISISGEYDVGLKMIHHNVINNPNNIKNIVLPNVIMIYI